MKLLVETVESCSNIVEVNEETQKKSYFIEGSFLHHSEPNRNGRLYEAKVMESAVNKFLDKIKDASALGELNHPNHPQMNMERACIKIQELAFDPKNPSVYGKAKVLGERFPCAGILRGMIDEGIKFGVSSRALGSVKANNEGINVVQPDLTINAIDVVSDPSGPSCFVNGIMEGAEWIFDEKTGIYVVAEEMRATIKKMPAKDVNENALRLFEQFLNKISKR